jgi:hypothetical protein
MSATGNAASLAESISRLEALGVELGKTGMRSRVVIRAGHVPYLHVASPVPGTALMSEDIYCAPAEGRWCYWWSWAERIAPDMSQAAGAISRVLRLADGGGR